MLPLHSLSADSLEQMSDDEFWNYARERANVVSWISSHEGGGQDQYLECELSRGNCLIPLKAIVEVVSPPHRFAKLPLIPNWMHGIVAWRGETIAAIDLDIYLSGLSVASPDGVLLVASHAESIVGLLVPGIGLTTTVQFGQMISSEPSIFYTPTRTSVVKGVYAEALVLNVSALLTDVVQQIEMAAHYG